MSTAANTPKVEDKKKTPPEIPTNPNVPSNPKLHTTMPPPEVKTVPGTEKKKRVMKAGTSYQLLKELEDATKMPLQSKQIVQILSKAENKTMNREDLIKAMVALPIQTRQPMERILGFYQSRLIAGDWIKLIPIVAVAPPPKVAKSESEKASE